MRTSDATTPNEDGDDRPDFRNLFAGLDIVKMLGTGYQEQIARALVPAIEIQRSAIEQMVASLTPSFQTYLASIDSTRLMSQQIADTLRGLNAMERQQVQDAVREATELTEEVNDLDLPDSPDEAPPADREERLVLLRSRIWDTLQKLARAELLVREKVKSGNDAVETYTKGIQNLTYALLAIMIFLDRIV